MRATGAGSRRMMESAVSDLPEPDSPAMHSVSPAATSKLSEFTTRLAPSGVATSTLRSRTVKTGSAVNSADGKSGRFCTLPI